MLIGLAIFTNIYTGPSMKSIHQSNSLNSFSRIPLYSCCERKAAFSIRPQNPRMKPRGTVIEARLNPFEKWTRRNISAFLPRGAFAVVPTSHRFPLVRFFFSPCDAKLIILSSLSSSIYLSTINAPHVTTVSPLSLSLSRSNRSNDSRASFSSCAYPLRLFSFSFSQPFFFFFFATPFFENCNRAFLLASIESSSSHIHVTEGGP